MNDSSWADPEGLPMSTVGTRRSRAVVPERVLAESDLADFRRQLHLSCDVQLTLASDVFGEPRTITAQVTKVEQHSFTVSFQDSNADEDAGLQELCFPDDGNIVSAKVLKDIPGVPKFHMSTKVIRTAPTWLLYYDGSSANKRSNAPAAAALVIKHLATNQCWVLCRFSPSSTNNCGEWSGCVAALKMALQLPGDIAIVGDAALVWSQLHGRSKCKAPHLQRYFNEASALRDRIDWTRISMHTMPGHGSDPQLADHPAKLCVALQRPLRFACRDANAQIGLHTTVIGDSYLVDSTSIQIPGFSVPLPEPSALFPELVPMPIRPARSGNKKRLTTQEMQDADASAIANTPQPLRVTSLSEYVRMRSFPARPEPPPEVREQWAKLVEVAMKRVTDAETQEAKNQAMLDLMVLPNAWLPANVATSRIISHFHRGEPFHISLERDKRPLAEKARVKRLEELVTRKAKNRDIRGAVSVLRSEVDAGSNLTDEQKLAALRAKHPQALAFEYANLLNEDMNLPTFHSGALHSVVRHMRRTAAPGIDAWQKGHLQCAMLHNPEVADIFCVLSIQVLRQQFSEEVMNCLRAARLVAVPKPDGGVRPIAITNFFLKVIGMMSLRAGNVSCSPYQYAIGRREGTKEIVHKLRSHKANGMVISKFDCTNAYNTIPRRLVEETMSRETCNYIKAYFRTVYYPSSALVVYHKGGSEVISSVEGVRQGDGLSTYMFCKALDTPIAAILSECTRQRIDVVDTLIYADDLNFVTRSAHDSARLAQVVKDVFRRHGLHINLGAKKSSAFIPPADQYWRDPRLQEMFAGLEYTAVSHNDEFVALGADLCELPDTPFLRDKKEKTTRFFNLLEQIDLHPAITFTILRLCGNPRLEYLCSVMPPSYGLFEVTQEFDRCLKRVLNGPSLLRGRFTVTSMLYDREGAGFIHYSGVSSLLFEETKRRLSAGGTGRARPVELVTTDTSLPVQRKGNDSGAGNGWLFYTGAKYELTPAEFVSALAIRLLLLPESVRLPVLCDCKKQLNTETDVIDHALACDRFTNFGHKARHDSMMYDALVPVARSYGLTCVCEPRCYAYDDASANRPDIIFGTTPRTTTDVTIVFPDVEVGVAAMRAAVEKEKKHKKAVETLGHKFIAFAMESFGYMDQSAHDLVKALANDLPPVRRRTFFSEIYHAISVACARGRANAVNSAIAKLRAVSTFGIRYGK